MPTHDEIPTGLREYPVAKGIDDVPLDPDGNLVAIAETASGKTMLIPAWEAMQADEPVLLRQPTRMTCTAVMGGLKHFWPNLKVGIHTRDAKSGLESPDIVVYSDGSLPALRSRYPRIRSIHFDEAHEPSVSSEIELGVARSAGIPVRCLSATIDPSSLVEYLGPDKTALRELKGRVHPVERDTRVGSRDLLDRSDTYELEGVVKEAAATLVDEDDRGLMFLPTKALCEKMASKAGIEANFVHGGSDPAEVLRWTERHADEPWLLFSPKAAATGITLDIGRVWVADEEIYSEERRGIQSTGTRPVADNALLQMSGRVARHRPGKATLVVPAGNGRPTNRQEPEKWLSLDRLPVQPRAVTPPCESVTPYTAIVQMAQAGVRPRDIDILSNIDAGEMSHAEDWLQRRNVVDSEGHLTKFGKRVASFPATPQVAHLILSAPQPGLQVALAAACSLGLGGTYGLTRIKPDDFSAIARRRMQDPSFDVWPRACAAYGSVPLSLAKTLAEFAAAPDRNEWCKANNLWPRPMWASLKDFEHAAAQLVREPLAVLKLLDFDSLQAPLWHHLSTHPLFRSYRMRGAIASGNGPFRPLDSTFANLWGLDERRGEYRCVAMERKQESRRRPGYFFHPLDMFHLAPGVRP